MDIRSHSHTGPQVAAGAELLEQMTSQLTAQQAAWLEQLRQQPQRLADVEVEVHHTFQQLADQVVAGLLAQATQNSPPLEAAQKK